MDKSKPAEHPAILKLTIILSAVVVWAILIELFSLYVFSLSEIVKSLLRMTSVVVVLNFTHKKVNLTKLLTAVFAISIAITMFLNSPAFSSTNDWEVRYSEITAEAESTVHSSRELPDWFPPAATKIYRAHNPVSNQQLIAFDLPGDDLRQLLESSQPASTDVTVPSNIRGVKWWDRAELHRNITKGAMEVYERPAANPSNTWHILSKGDKVYMWFTPQDNLTP